MLIAGLTGGLACGKSFVANAMRDLGAYVIEADELGHRALLPSGEAYAPVLAEFGTGILAAGGEIDRAKLAALVFADPAKLLKLNAIVHPAVRASARRTIDEIAGRDPRAVILYVAAILLESGGLPGMSRLILVSCTPEQQMARALERPGSDEKRVRAILAHQTTTEDKAIHAHYAIDAGGTKEATLRQTKMVFEELRKLA